MSKLGMTVTAGRAVDLQLPVARFGRALNVPRRLLAMHPRRRGHPGNAAALAPAITLGVISAFEGFVEDFVATGLVIRGASMAQVAKAIGNLNNPDVSAFQRLLVGQLHIDAKVVGSAFSVDIWKPPVGTTWWNVSSLDWTEAARDAQAWMQVRHLLTHGLTSGWQAEYWPAPLSKAEPPPPPASSVLRIAREGRHALAIHGAISCARVYVECARHLAQLTASGLGLSIDLSAIPDFPLAAEEAAITSAAPAISAHGILTEEAVDDDLTPA